MRTYHTIQGTLLDEREMEREREHTGRTEPVMYISASPTQWQGLGRQYLCLIHFRIPMLSPKPTNSNCSVDILPKKSVNIKASQPRTKLHQVYHYSVYK